MKKTALSLLALILSVGLFAGCTSGKPADGKYRIGIVQPVEHTSLDEIRETIIDALNASEYADTIEITYKNGQGDATNINTIVKQFVGERYDMIIPIATGAAQVAAGETKEIPIVFAASSAPVEAGLVPALDDTSGNVTGVSDAIPVEDILDLAVRLTPEVKTFGLLYNSGEPNSVANISRAKAHLDANGLAYREVTITASGDLLQAVQSMLGKVDAIFTPNDNTVASAMSTLAAEAIKANTPVYVGADSMVIDGGLATVGVDYKVLGRQVADMAIRIMNGESIAENHVEVLSAYSNIVNPSTAESIGLVLPQDVLDTFVLIEGK